MDVDLQVQRVKKIIVERWICDKCNVAKFDTYEEACNHEDQCQIGKPITAAPRIISRNQQSDDEKVVVTPSRSISEKEDPRNYENNADQKSQTCLKNASSFQLLDNNASKTTEKKGLVESTKSSVIPGPEYGLKASTMIHSFFSKRVSVVTNDKQNNKKIKEEAARTKASRKRDAPIAPIFTSNRAPEVLDQAFQSKSQKDLKKFASANNNLKKPLHFKDSMAISSKFKKTVNKAVTINSQAATRAMTPGELALLRHSQQFQSSEMNNLTDIEHSRVKLKMSKPDELHALDQFPTCSHIIPSETTNFTLPEPSCSTTFNVPVSKLEKILISTSKTPLQLPQPRVTDVVDLTTRESELVDLTIKRSEEQNITKTNQKIFDYSCHDTLLRDAMSNLVIDRDLICSKANTWHVPSGICGELNKATAKRVLDFVIKCKTQFQETLSENRVRRDKDKLCEKPSRTLFHYNSDSSDDEGVSDACSVLILTGDLGKTQLVYRVAAAAQCDVIEINTTHPRGGSALKNAIEEATLSQSLAMDAKMPVILLDEVDLMFEQDGSDAGFWHALKRLALKSTVPILLTASQIPEGLFTSSIRHQVERLERPSLKECTHYFLNMFKIPDDQKEPMRTVCQILKCDIRRILIELQLNSFSRPSTILTYKPAENITFTVDKNLITKARMLDSPPTIHSIIPKRIALNYGGRLEINGSNFASPIQLWIGGKPFHDFEIISVSRIHVTIPPNWCDFIGVSSCYTSVELRPVIPSFGTFSLVNADEVPIEMCYPSMLRSTSEHIICFYYVEDTDHRGRAKLKQDLMQRKRLESGFEISDDFTVTSQTSAEEDTIPSTNLINGLNESHQHQKELHSSLKLSDRSPTPPWAHCQNAKIQLQKELSILDSLSAASELASDALFIEAWIELSTPKMSGCVSGFGFEFEPQKPLNSNRPSFEKILIGTGGNHSFYGCPDALVCTPSSPIDRRYNSLLAAQRDPRMVYASCHQDGFTSPFWESEDSLIAPNMWSTFMELPRILKKRRFLNHVDILDTICYENEARTNAKLFSKIAATLMGDEDDVNPVELMVNREGALHQICLDIVPMLRQMAIHEARKVAFETRAGGSVLESVGRLRRTRSRSGPCHYFDKIIRSREDGKSGITLGRDLAKSILRSQKIAVHTEL